MSLFAAKFQSDPMENMAKTAVAQLLFLLACFRSVLLDHLFRINVTKKQKHAILNSRMWKEYIAPDVPRPNIKLNKKEKGLPNLIGYSEVSTTNHSRE